MNIVGGIVLLLIGLFTGLYLPDIDYRIAFLTHRSMITHSFFLPILLFIWIRKQEPSILYLLSVGVNLSYAVHLCFDLFPQAWRGFALIYVPYYGRMSPLYSWIWIGGSLLVCLYLALVLIRNWTDILIFLGSFVIVFRFYNATERVFWSAVVTLAVAIIVVLLLPSDEQQVFKKLYNHIVPDRRS